MRLLAAAICATAAIGCAAAAPAFDWGLPAGVAPPPVPADNPMSQAKVELGRRLFYDADLSIDGTLSCASCHEQHRAFAHSNATRPGVREAPGRRNPMGLANVGYFTRFTWADPKLASLEEQAGVPITGLHPVEMGMHGQETEIVRRLGSDACYRRMFAAAFPETGGEVSFVATTKAIAAFQRTLISFSSPYDAYLRGDRSAISETARRGERRFRETGCSQCHAGTSFTDGEYHVIAPSRGGDEGAYEKTGLPVDRAAFRTPSLRNVGLTAPYLHDGSAKTLRTAIGAHEGLAGMTDQDLTEIEAFLAALTDPAFIADERHSVPKTFCGAPRVR
ncbi:MAG: cytochrome c peroxidase [Phenylobacterium sp.]|jgi:cytochrome c peroxidase|uniref:cytochrome-c peroxidase n=1 Tax=Phenylobacterium sp. TaxID=1871053 RepID=UPI002A32DD94|nr:cytochrome c peroxidase [Phenylobacterium sp.]MDD3837728.1 cytochrome c peroxidase [Phenylobacterium sp.]MDX9998626.1 cytochrome c peroxidase [Phenylobacterium sp.]